MKKPQEIKVPEIRYVGEQNGEPEQDLKQRLCRFFERDPSVKAAYLARVNYGHAQQVGVALCLKTVFGPDKGLVEKIGAIFAAVFNASEHLDILFLDESQESDLRKVCSSFYNRQT
ncbi:MAG TPA: enhanced serine sensitivity protein SseB C-terminal domain-containing protein [Candidatus Paceibacterota bacterium]|nr:enhanced serine sensitivity protein SseB C-terminal domain-containing protein [Verrucomicrobiota bacterium]HRY49541.1 enhanced serine sensitivity protein SseB C-terminal domain-containing protein [Candidatus Paceibacterota bacterium]